MEILSDENIWIADRSDTLEPVSQPKLSIIKNILGFFSLTQEDRLKAGICIRAEEYGDEHEHTVSSYFLRTPSDKID
jgi:hypothetical protein